MDDDDNLKIEEVEAELVQLGNNGRTECGQWIPPSHINVIKVGRYTFGGQLLVEIFWWNLFVWVRSKINAIQQHWSGLPSWDDMDLPNGNTNTHRKEKIRKSKRDVKGQLRLPTSSSVVCAWICWCLFHVTATPETCCQYALPSATTFLSESNT